VALQVRTCEKYNLLLESELGVRIGRPVEVISLGRNNGDIAANFRRVRDIAMKFKPDVVLLEHCGSLMMQMHPELLRRTVGWDHAHCALDNFTYDENGRLTFHPSAADWPQYVEKPDTSELTPGLPLMDLLRVPREHLHPLARENFQYLVDIVHYYQKEFPTTKIVLHTGLDQAQCRAAGQRNVRLPDGTTIPVGVEIFMRNLAEFCDEQGIACLQPPVPQGFSDKPETYLTFINDGHYSPRGHQWLARQLAEGLIRAMGLPNAPP
jgi:hypothetical protein